MIDINLNLPIDTTPTDASTNLIDSNAVFDGLATKVDKVTGKQLSTEDYTTTEKSKLAGIAAGAEVNVNADFNAVSGDAQILNKPTYATYISDTITDGEITKAPTQNAVFDALALKENNLPSIVGNSLKVLRVNAGETAKEWATISTGLTIGTTPITSGTVGRVLFEGAGNVAQESAGLTFSPTYSETIITNPSSFSGNQINYPLLRLAQPLLSFGNSSVMFRAIESSINNTFSIALYKRSGYNETQFLTGGAGNGLNSEVGFMTVTGTNSTGVGQGNIYFNKQVVIGNTTTGGAFSQLDVRAQGALSTDIAFRVRNSADTLNLFAVSGDSSWISRNNSNSNQYIYWNGTNKLELKNDTAGESLISNNFSVLGLTGGTGLRLSAGNKGIYIYNSGNFYLGNATGIQAGSGQGNILFANNTAPTTNIADHHYYYSADIVAGNAAPHFRTENGSVIKLYKQDLPTSPTNAEIATFLSNLGLANLI